MFCGSTDGIGNAGGLGVKVLGNSEMEGDRGLNKFSDISTGPIDSIPFQLQLNFQCRQDLQDLKKVFTYGRFKMQCMYVAGTITNFLLAGGVC